MYKRELKDGRVEYLERYRDPLTEKYKYASVTMFPQSKRTDERMAREALDRKITECLAQSGQPQDITLSELIHRRIDWERENLKPQTAEYAKMHLRTVERLIGGDVIVAKLNAGIVSSRLMSDSPAAVTYNERLKHFKSLLRWGYRNDYVTDISYLDKLQRRKEPPVREKNKFKYLEHNEITELLSSMKVEKWNLLTEFLILSGLRVGEAIALNDSDVDINRRKITVSKTYAFNLQRISSTKTDTSNRKIYMQDELLDCCIRIKHVIRIEKLQFAYTSGIFLPELNTGGYLSYGAYCKYFREITERVLGRRLTPHSLRHTHTAMLAEAGVPLEDISRRLGHADSKITREVYMHVTEKMNEVFNSRIKGIRIMS